MQHSKWLEKCNYWKKSWPVMQDEYHEELDGINLYAVLDYVNRHSEAEDTIVGDAGSISYAGPVALNPKKGQRLIFSPSQADMGWAVPAAIGVGLETLNRVICITGDGSLMTNIQELATVSYHNLNVKIIILNNSGYLSIKNTQEKYFNGRVYGASVGKGFSMPDFKVVADAFGLGYEVVENSQDLKKIVGMFNHKGPQLIDVKCTSEQEILPYQALKNGKQAGPHDMFPHLDESVLTNEMVVPLPYVKI